MASPPELDGRRARELRREITELAPYYTPSWDPDAGGVGAGLVDVFGELGAEVTERLDATPEKHRLAFYDALGFGQRPPQAARVPVQYAVVPEAPDNVAVQPGTAALAEAGEPVTFHVPPDAAFEATPARLRDVLAVLPDGDAVYDQSELVDGGSSATLWTGRNRQSHEWFLGDTALLSAGAADTLVVDLDSAVDPDVLVDEVEWHYFGATEPDGPADWRRLSPAEDIELVDAEGDVALALSPAGPLVERAVDGVESKWLRCRVPPGSPVATERPFTVDFVGLTTETSGTGYPDTLLANDVPLENPTNSEEPIRPFGDQPRPNDAFYVAASAAFSKPGAAVTLTFTPVEAAQSTDGGSSRFTGIGAVSPSAVSTVGNTLERYLRAGGGDANPTLSWEYWDGDGWSRIETITDGTSGFTAREEKTVEFTVPNDLAPTTVAGHEGHWIRARLVGGDYGTVVHVPQTSEGTRWARQTTGSPPEYVEIALSYTVANRREPSHVRARNGLATTAVAPDESFRPFTSLPEREQTLYLGFDAPLSGGPIQLFAGIDERPSPADFTPQIRWERRQADGGWTQLQVEDGTASLTEQGIVGLGFADRTVATNRFGRERHWLRARVTGDEFEVVPDLDAEAGTESEDRRTGGNGDGSRTETADIGATGSTDAAGTTLSACGETVATEPPSGEPNERPPSLTGLHPNTGWARNVRAVTDELLGGSDGEPDQSFAVANPPALDPAVWVDERSALAEPQRTALLAERPEDVTVERTGDGAVRAVWVRWTVVPDLLDSPEDARHCVVDETAGEVRFGDDTNGRIPPRGTDNLRASYLTGGGSAGNVPVGAVGKLKSSLPFVDAVTNPAPGAGGADQESRADLRDRAPQTLRDRDRAVMPTDYERLAADASRRIARARCLPGMDRGGNREPGYVTVLVVPDNRTATPVPSLGLLDRVERSLGDHAPASVVANDRLVVRGPSYVSVGIDADVVTGDVGSLQSVEGRLRSTIDEFLHPLTGRDDAGWPFGDLPSRSDVFALLEGVEGVDHVESLFLTFTGTETVTVGEGAREPDASPDALVRGGEHDVTVVPGGGEPWA
jgi:predicted phage baseplate assembly protein